ncbi:MAG: amidophosphoribosyltransferase [Bacteroidota bacterium]
MSDALKHECGIAFIRLLKPYEYYIEKYNTPLYGLNKLYLLMEKQHNRGQDGAGVASVKLNAKPGNRYISRQRSIEPAAIKDIFSKIYGGFSKVKNENQALFKNATYLKENVEFAAEVLMGHLRYGTHGVNTIDSCHPFHRTNSWKTRNLVMAGNFNMTNAKELFEKLVELGQHPIERGDTVTVLEKIGHFLDDEVQKLFERYKQNDYTNEELTNIISDNLDVKRILSRSTKDFDGGYALMGMVGNGDSFILRDPNGIRPAYYYIDDEVCVVASERPCIQTTFNVHIDSIKEITPGHALILKVDGTVKEEKIQEPKERKACSFERIYFSRGTDKDIYNERKELGYLLTEPVMKALNHDYVNSVFSFVPNTAEVAFYGLIKGVEDSLNKKKKDAIKRNHLSEEKLLELLNERARIEKIAVKDVKLRTFIADDSSRDELVSHVYDITYGSIVPHVDTLIMMDDSIVRGTTLKKSILSILSRLDPKKIIIVSSAPQIRYPDCYGIDMSKMSDFIAFKAAIALHKERNTWYIMDEVYRKCKESELNKTSDSQNYVKEVYKSFTVEEISKKIAEIVKPIEIFSEVEVIYQSIESLHEACKNNTGDWYFTGNYPTPGGNRVVNRSFMNYMEGKDERAY